MAIHHHVRQHIRKKHVALCERSSHYAAWHEHRHHRRVHYGVFALYIAILFSVIFSQAFDIYKYRGMAAPLAKTISAQEDWEQGALTNIDTTSVPGDIKIEAQGSWGARVWKNPPDPITSGMAMTSSGTDIYVFRGGGFVDFWKYSPSTNSWSALANAPHSTSINSSMTYVGPDTIYAVFGQYIRKFYSYSISTNTWTELEDTPNVTGPGSALVTVGTGVYLIRGTNAAGQGTQDFWHYQPGTGWSTKATTNAVVLSIGAIAYDGSQYIYLLRGGATRVVERYNVGSNIWENMTTLYPNNFNEASTLAFHAGSLYLSQSNSVNFYRCEISALTCVGGAWQTLTPLPVAQRYGGVLYHSGDGYMYLFRANAQLDFWKYDIATNQFIGTPDFPQSTTTGGNLLWDGGDYVYGLRGGAAANSFHRLNINTAGASWEARNVTNLPALSVDAKAVYAGGYIYLFQGGNTNFLRYNTATNDNWETLTGPALAPSHGAGLAYDGSQYIYATRASNTNTFYAYDTLAGNWTWKPEDLPTGANVGIGGRIVYGGGKVYVLLGLSDSRVFEYTYAVGGGSWVEKTSAPFNPYYGTDIAYHNGKIYATAGYYTKEFYEFDTAGNSWRKLKDLQTDNTTGSILDRGPYAGASVTYVGNNTLFVALGNSTGRVLNYYINSDDYFLTGQYTSPAIDLTYVQSWVSLTLDATNPSDSSVSVQTRSSDDGANWSAYDSLANTLPKRFIQVRLTLNRSTDGDQTPTVRAYTINYNPDETEPGEPSNFACYSQQVGGTQLDPASTHRFTSPYCTWDHATDNNPDGIDGYYVYFGPNQAAIPSAVGSFQTANSFVVDKPMATGSNYLIVQARDKSGVTRTVPTVGFHYQYSGISPYGEVVKSSTAHFEQGSLINNIATAGDKLRLDNGDSFWQQTRLTPLPVAPNLGASIVYKSSTGLFYISRGANTATVWTFNAVTNEWGTLNTTGLGTIGTGGGIVNAPGDYIYAIRGNNSNTFYRCDVVANNGCSDEDAEDPGLAFGQGGQLIYDGTRYIYGLRGNATNYFYRFDPLTTSDGQWDTLEFVNWGLQTPNQNVYAGGGIVFDGDNTIYAIQGNQYTGGFSRYTISGAGANTWTPLSPLPNAPGAGSSMSLDEVSGDIYYTPGASSSRLYAFTPSTGLWREVSEVPSIVGAGGAMKIVDQKLYLIQGVGQLFYLYDIVKDTWHLPSMGVFGTVYKGIASLSTNATYYGSGIIYGGNNHFYAMRGLYDGIFIRYNSETGKVQRMANLPIGTYSGAHMVYIQSENAIYMIPGSVRNAFYKYSIDTNSWAEIASDPPPIISSSGSSLLEHGNYIYYMRGANTTSWYRYDRTADEGSRWSGVLPATGLGGFGNGSQAVIHNGYVYGLRGQAVNPNPFYRFDLAQLGVEAPYTGSWESLATLPQAVSNDGFLALGDSGKFYAAPANNTSNFYEYTVSTNSWAPAQSFPGQLSLGAAGRSNGVNRIAVLPGNGTNTFNDAIYSFVFNTDESAFKEVGRYESEVFDFSGIYGWSNIKAKYQRNSNTAVTLQTRSSSDNINWSSWQNATLRNELPNDYYEHSINSPVNRYLQVAIDLSSGDGVYTPEFHEYNVYYYADTTQPLNPTALAQAKSAVSDGVDLVSANYYNHPQPYFAWPVPDAPDGASDIDGSGVDGYFVYFGTSGSALPSQTRGIANSVGGNPQLRYQTATSFTVGVDSTAVSHNNIYHLRLQTRDKAGNTQGEAWTAFSYRVDMQAPQLPTSLSVSPVGYTNIDQYTFTIANNATDTPAGLLKYQYRTANDVDIDENALWYDFNPLLSTSITIPNIDHPEGKYQDGANIFYLRVLDTAGNISTPMSIQYYYGSSAPSPPQNLRVIPPDGNTVNSFTFEWEPPIAYIGDVSKITYHYSVNALPTPFNTNSTSALAVGPGAFATQYLDNIFYVVAKDEAGNIDYSQFNQVVFTAATSAPGAPTSLNVNDISNKETDEYRLVISWNASTISDPGNFREYEIFHATTQSGPFSRIDGTTGTAYVHVGLAKDSRHYYYVRAIDRTNNQSAPSSIEDQVATGKYTTPPNIVREPRVSVGSRRATIDWITSREASSSVEYGTDPNDLKLTDGNAATDYRTEHVVEMGKSIFPNTTYYYRVVFVDPDGNVGKSEEIRSFTTTDDPSVSSLTKEDIGLDSMLISWKSNIPSYGSIVYGENANRLDMEVTEEPYYTLDHVVKLRDLRSGTRYYFQVRAKDAEGNPFSSDIYDQDTLPMPSVLDFKVENKLEVDQPTVVVYYTTNVETTTSIVYTPLGGAAKEYAKSEYAKEHSAEISNLAESQPYVFELTGRDRYGNQVQSEVYSISTLADTMPPRILNQVDRKRVLGQGSNAEAQLTVKITANELCTVKVEVSRGIGSTTFDIVGASDSASAEHTVILKLGDPGASYSYRVRATDLGGNVTLTDTKTFVIPGANKSAIEYIASIFSRSFGWLGTIVSF